MDIIESVINKAQDLADSLRQLASNPSEEMMEVAKDAFDGLKTDVLAAQSEWYRLFPDHSADIADIMYKSIVNFALGSLEPLLHKVTEAELRGASLYREGMENNAQVWEDFVRDSRAALGQ